MKSFFKLSLLIVVVLLNSNAFSMNNSFLFRRLTMYTGNPTPLGTCTMTTEEKEEGNPVEDGSDSRPAVRINQQAQGLRKWYDGAYYLLGNKKLGLLFGTTFNLEGVMSTNSQPGSFREYRRYYITPWGIAWLSAGAATVAGAAYYAYNYLRN